MNWLFLLSAITIGAHAGTVIGVWYAHKIEDGKSMFMGTVFSITLSAALCAIWIATIVNPKGW